MAIPKAKLQLVEAHETKGEPPLATKKDEKAVALLRDIATTAPEPISGGVVPTELMEWIYLHLKQMAVEICEPAGFPLPEIVVSVETSNKRQLGHFKIGRDGLGLKWRVSLNLIHLTRPRGDVLATLLHEMLHAWQHAHGQPPKRAKTHNVAFREACERLGIPTNEKGQDLGITPDGMLARYLKRHKIDGTVALVDKRDRVKPKGSTLAKMVCSCESEDLVPLRVAWGKVDALDATCNRCGQAYHLAE